MAPAVTFMIRMKLVAWPRSRFVVAVAAIVLGMVGPAAAQAPDDRRVSLGAAAGIATPFHGDFDFTATAWQADVRVATARHFGFSVFFEDWRHRNEQQIANQVISGPGGVLGRADLVTIRTEHQTRALGWSLLVRGSAGRLTVNGGGGVSYLRYSRDFSQTLTGCEPASICRDATSSFENNRFAGQVQASIDVALASHVALMAQYRLFVPVQDPGSGHATAVGGLRVVF